MAMVDWRIKGMEFGACNCNWGCPCQFNALPSSGNCTGGLTMKIDTGHFGKVKLDGIVWGFCCEWPGAVHEGNGKMQVYVDDRASDEQRNALVEICYGKHSAEGTFFSIFSATSPHKLPPIFARVDYTIDADKRTASVHVPGLFDLVGEPIRNPITGDAHFPRLDLPAGFEFKTAEFASCTSKSSGPINLNRDKGHAHFAPVHWGPQGYIA
jgi:hypothetical protein